MCASSVAAAPGAIGIKDAFTIFPLMLLDVYSAVGERADVGHVFSAVKQTGSV